MSPISSPAGQKTLPMLIVEDSNEDFETFQRLLQRSSRPVPIQRCMNGDQALAFLYRTGSYADPAVSPRPGIIILDLNLPGTDGREVLRRIKQDDHLRMIPVIIFTTSNNPKDISDCYEYGANSYIIKPIDFTQLKRDIQLLVSYWYEVTSLPDRPLGTS